MVDLATDLDNLHEMIDEETEKLRATDPDHELLRFANAFEAKEEHGGELADEFLRRFAPPGTIVMHMWCNYLTAIRDALGK